MLTKPLLVPSNNALRVLRQLAFAGSTIATIGVVTLNYNVHNRIRLAEQCLETKKQIRALSSGNREAHMARVIEAAENGQDFTIQAMRERRSREKRFKPSLSSLSGSQSSIAHEIVNSPIPHGGESSHHKREQRTQEIRKATVEMTATAPTHTYGRPARHWKPTRAWPAVKIVAGKALETQAPPAGKDRLYTKGEDAATKIKRATMAMTSTAPLHVYGRPSKVVSKARPNLHHSLASWLSTATEDDSQPDAAPAPENLLLTSTPDDMNLEHLEKPTLLIPECIEYNREGAAKHPGSLDSEKNTKAVDTTLAGDSQRTSNVQDHQLQNTINPSQQSFNSGTHSRRTNRLHQEIHASFVSHQDPEGTFTEPLQSVSQDSCTVDALKTASDISNVASMINEISNADSGKHRSLTFAANDAAQNLQPAELLTSFRISSTAPALVSVETLSGGLRSHDEANKNESNPAMGSAITEGGSAKSKPFSDNASFPRQAYHNFQLEQPPTVDKAHPPNLRSWQHLESSDGSNDTIKEQPRLGEQVVDLKEDDTPFQQDQIRYGWTPFPPILQGPESTVSLPKPKQGVVSSEDAELESQAAALEPHEAPLTWTPFSYPYQPPEQWTDDLKLKQDDVSLCPDPWPASEQPEDFMDALTEELKASSQMTRTEKVHLALHIHRVFSSEGSLKGEKAWHAIVMSRLLHSDFATVDFLYAEFVEQGTMSISARHRVVRSLVRWHFERSKYSERAAEILFPDQRSGATDLAESKPGYAHLYPTIWRENKRESLFAIHFLRSLWEKEADPDWLLLNFRRVIMASKLRGVKLVEGIFGVVIRSFTSVGDMPTAQAIYDEMIFYHQLEATFHSRSLLIRGYARLCDWHRVEREIEFLHLQGLSRTRPHGYALMINAVLQEYAARASIMQFQDLLIRSIGYWGLVPTSGITITIVQTYLSYHRYDLVTEWMETLQILFPQLEFETSSFQWSLGSSWLRTGASCEDIEKAIKAVAYRNPHTKLKTFSLPMVHEALSHDLAAKLDTVRAKTALCQQESTFSSTEDNDFMYNKTVDDYLSAALSLITSLVAQNHQLSPEVIELHRQATAVQRLSTFLTSTPSSEAVDQFSFPDPEFDTATEVDTVSSPVPKTVSLFHLQDTIPRVLTAEFLPKTPVIITTLLGFYRLRAQERLPTDHNLLLWVCQKLQHADRAFSALNVIRKVYDDVMVRRLAGINECSPSDLGKLDLPGQGAVGFGIQFYEFWVQLAWERRTLKHLRSVMEEVLRMSRPGREFSYRMDDGSVEKLLTEVKITFSFLFLLRSIASRGLKKGSPKWSNELGDVPAREVVWLIKQLERRREYQIGRTEEGTWTRMRMKKRGQSEREVE